MKYAAITAAVFGGALFVATGSHASLADARHFNSVINKPHTETVQVVARDKKPSAVARGRIDDAPLAAQVPEPPKPVMVVVQPGDTLTKLAAANGTSYQRLYDANPGVASPDLILPGQDLRVPTADEVLTPRPLPESVVAPAPAPTFASTSPPVATPAAPAVVPTAPSVATPSTAPTVANGSVWDRLAMCESGGNWAINTGNGFYGGLQFTLASWRAVGGTGMPNEASREEQIARGQILQARGGWGNWPACTAKLGIG